MHINPYLNFHGRCAEAFAFYHSVLGGEPPLLMRYRGSPAEDMAPEHWRDKIMHASLAVGPTMLMGSDGQADDETKASGQGCSMTLNCDSDAHAAQVFTALAQGGTVVMPLAPTFFASAFGMLRDRFGIHWMVMFPLPDQAA